MKRTTGVVVLVTAMMITTLSGAAASPTARDIEAGCPESRVSSAGFADTPGTTFQTEIDCVVWWGIASGRSASSYGPQLSTNRAQMATFLANLIRETGGELPDNPPSAFGDTRGSVHEDNINALAAVGVVAGTTGTTYSPSRTVSREQMATFIFRTYEHLTGEELTADQDYFGDISGSVHEDSINAIAQVGITGGDDTGNFRPAGEVTRGAMAAFLARTLDLLVDTGFASPPPLPDAVLGVDMSRVSVSSRSGFGSMCTRGLNNNQESIDGSFYEFSRSCYIQNAYPSGWEEYDLGRDYSRFTATIGQADRSENTQRNIRFTVYGDGDELYTRNLGFGSSAEVDVDVTGVLRLRLEVANLSEGSPGQTWVAWGAPTVGG